MTTPALEALIARFEDLRALAVHEGFDEPGDNDLAQAARAELFAADSFRTEMRCYPSYDHRDEGGGAHGMRLAFLLRGPDAVLSAVISTGWMRHPLVGSYLRGAGQQRRSSNVGLDRTLASSYPSGSTVSLHSPTKVKDWWHGPDKCDLLPGGECYGDTGYTLSDQVLERLVEGGDEAVWPFLVEIYQEWMAYEHKVASSESH
jgi:hypothetical protein